MLSRYQLVNTNYETKRLSPALYKHLVHEKNHPIFKKLDTLSNKDIKALLEKLNLKVSNRHIKKFKKAIAEHFFEKYHPLLI